MYAVLDALDSDLRVRLLSALLPLTPPSLKSSLHLSTPSMAEDDKLASTTSNVSSAALASSQELPTILDTAPTTEETRSSQVEEQQSEAATELEELLEDLKLSKEESVSFAVFFLSEVSTGACGELNALSLASRFSSSRPPALEPTSMMNSVD